VNDRVIRPRFRSDPLPEPFRVTFASDLAGKDPAPVEWIVPGLIPRKHLTMLAGPPTVGKSFLVLMLMVASWARQTTWFGLPIEAQVRSYAVFSEDSEDSVHARFQRIAAEFAVDPFDLDEGRVAWTAEPSDGTAFDPTLYRCGDGPGRPTDLWQQIAGDLGHCTELGCGLLVIDNIGTALDGEDVPHILGFVNMLKRYAAQRNLAILLLHHPRLNGQGNGLDRVYAGRQQWGKSIRHILSLERPRTYDPYTGEDADKLVLRVAGSNLPGEKPTLHLRRREGFLELADAPASLRAKFPLSQSERADLDLRVLTALRYEIGRGHRVLSDPVKPESLFVRLRRSGSWQHVAPGDLESSIDRLISRGQIVVDKNASQAILKPAT
jgi:RecA-family ATPase